MTRTHKSLWLVALVLVASLAALGQVATAPTIKVKQPKAKVDSFKGEVVNCTPAAITVRSPGNAYAVRTFSFSPELARKMENHRMEPGSPVTVKYQHMTDTAVALKGKILNQ